METLTNRLHSTRSSDQEEKKRLCEQLGDRAASLTCYKLAIQYYKKMVGGGEIPSLARWYRHDFSCIKILFSLSVSGSYGVEP